MRSSKFVFIYLFMVGLLGGCAHQKITSIDEFTLNQKNKVIQNEVYEDADLIFWTAAYRPTVGDIQEMKKAWTDHTNAFPESRSIKDIEEALRSTKQQIIVIALFAPEVDTADLRNKTHGWAIGPVPQNITELEEKDVPLRTLMPVKNDWARYFLLKFDRTNSINKITVSKRSYKVDLLVQ